MSNIDFEKVESLRRHMLLTVGDIANVLGVSRQTYYQWKRGSSIQGQREIEVKKMLKMLLSLIASGDWPTPEVIASNQKQRYEKLLEVLANMR